MRCILSFLPARLSPATFVVCGTVASAANERSRQNRRPLPWRILSSDMVMYAGYIVCASIPLVSRFYTYTTSMALPATMILFPFPGVLVKMLKSISNVTVPLRYMLWPPTVPERASLVEEDETGVWRPRNDWDKSVIGNEGWWIGTFLCEWLVIWCCGW